MQEDIKKKLVEQLPEILDDNEIKLLLEKLNAKSFKEMNLELWREEIKNAKKNGFFSVPCIRSAQSWGTCAVGSRLQVENPQLARYFNDLYLIRDDINTPTGFLTQEAKDLGVEFCHAVTNNEVEKAEKYFNEIQNLQIVLKKDEEKLNQDIKTKYDSMPPIKQKKYFWQRSKQTTEGGERST